MKICNIFAQTALFASILVSHVQVATAQLASRPSVAEVEDYIKRSVLVGFEWVDQPLNRILLLRSDKAMCAIRFLSYRRNNDARVPTSFDTGDANQFATYEISEFVIAGSEVRPGPVVRKKLDYRGMRGIGRLAFHVGKTSIKCGRERYPWSFPTGVGLPRNRQGPAIAPTNWMGFDEVRIDHPKLRWYEVDPQLQRPFIAIPLEELPP